jgi:hypothetical protein
MAAATSTLPTGSGFWIAARRPVFLTIVLAGVASLLATSVASIRPMAPTAIYWSFVAVCEILALTIVVWRRRRERGLPTLVDAFFAGHAAWTLFLLAIGGTLAFMPPGNLWFLITRPAPVGLVLVVAWSAYIDVCFFRYMCGARLSRAIRDVVFHRMIAWTLIFWIFAVPEPTPFGVVQEIVEALVELF